VLPELPKQLAHLLVTMFEASSAASLGTDRHRVAVSTYVNADIVAANEQVRVRVCAYVFGCGRRRSCQCVRAARCWLCCRQPQLLTFLGPNPTSSHSFARQVIFIAPFTPGAAANSYPPELEADVQALW
jgi:hypothetical protein